MQQGALPFEVSASALLPPAIGNLLRPLDPALRRLILPNKLMGCFPVVNESGMSASAFARQFLENLDIRYDIPDQDRSRIPTKGGALIVANHPFGFLEGLILLALLEEIRSDYRIIANSLLARVPPLHSRLIFVNVLSENPGAHENTAATRAAIEWIRSGGLVVTFPAGEVSHLNWGERPVTDPNWSTSPARLARKLGCPTVPLYFKGANSGRFQMMGTIHPSLRTLSLAHELKRKCKTTVGLRVGVPIPAATLKGYPAPEVATEYLRARTYLLGTRVSGRSKGSFLASKPFFRQREVLSPLPAALMQREIDALPPSSVLAQNEEFAVYLASAAEIPQGLREIGRLRELTYRAIGEGTGKPTDLDEFDAYYKHLVLWDTQNKCIAGAYRLAATPDVLSTRGVGGLYTSTLFEYEDDFFRRIGPALELGRSFICAEYQKRYSPLLLLWKGILAYLVRRPECAVLFGAVTVSSEYQRLSRTLIVDFLNGHISHAAARCLRPRTPFQGKAIVPKQIKQLGRLVPTVEELSATIQDLEKDRKGLPILIKQYLKIGGELLGSNVDPNFSNALDVLVMADLRTATGPMLKRCLGEAGAEVFRARHAEPVAVV
jgi:putative hemolysin